jgi:hypothetical protein
MAACRGNWELLRAWVQYALSVFSVKVIRHKGGRRAVEKVAKAGEGSYPRQRAIRGMMRSDYLGDPRRGKIGLGRGDRP